MTVTALFDACVLYPAPLRDLLIQLAHAGLFSARWTEQIHEEWVRNLLANRPDLKESALRLTVQAMNQAVDRCMVTGYEELITGLHLPDPDDRHVLAAAIAGRADVIVTLNLRDFPATALAPFGVEAQHPDLFIRHVLEQDTAAMQAVRACRARLRSPPKSVDEYLATLEQQSLPETVGYLRDWASVL